MKHFIFTLAGLYLLVFLGFVYGDILLDLLNTNDTLVNFLALVAGFLILPIGAAIYYKLYQRIYGVK